MARDVLAVMRGGAAAFSRGLSMLVLVVACTATWAEDPDFCLDQFYGNVGPTTYRETGRDVELTGQIEQIMAMGPGGQTGCGYYLTGTDVGASQPPRHYTLVFGANPPQSLPTGTSVTLHGKLNGGVLSLRSGSDATSLRVVSMLPQVSTPNAISVTVILVNFQDSTLTATPAQIDGMINSNASSLSRYYNEASNGNLSVTGVIKGPYTIPYNGLGACDYGLWATAADAAAGVSDGYRIYVLAPSGCGWGGLANILGYQSWINGAKWNWQDAYCHEFGHNLGMHHARSGGSEYADHSDCMGNPTNPPHLNAPHEVYMGWIPPSNVTTITTYGSYTYTITALERNAPGTQIIKLPKADTSDDYYVSYRAPIGLDASNLESGYQFKTSVHHFAMGVNFTDLQGVCGDGETYADTANTISVTQVSHTATTATIIVNYGVTGTSPQITNTPPLSTLVNQVFTWTVTASGTPNPTYSLSAFPAGMSIDQNSGRISWTPTSIGSFPVTIVASNGHLPDAQLSFSLQVTASSAAPAITSTAITTVVLGSSYRYAVTATGSPVPSFQLGTHPSGMTIDSTSGIISWAPTAPGSFPVTVTATNGVAPNATQSFSVSVLSAPHVTSPAVVDAVVGTPYTYTVTVDGNPAPTLALTAGPSGMTLDSGTGALKWTPSLAGDVHVTVTADNGVAPAASQSFTIVVKPAPSAPTITWTPLTTIGVNTSYSQTVTATGTPSPTYSLSSSPAGMTITADTGVIAWMPSVPGVYPVTVVATNGVNPDATLTYLLRVTAAPQITSLAPTQAVIGSSYTYPVIASGYPAATFSLTAAPPGMTIDANSGLLTWIPGTAGTFPVTVAATNGISPNGGQSFDVVVHPAIHAPVFMSLPALVGHIGVPYAESASSSGYPQPTYALTNAPPGMTISAEGIISWKPRVRGMYTVTEVAANGIMPNATRTFSIAVDNYVYMGNTSETSPGSQCGIGSGSLGLVVLGLGALRRRSSRVTSP